MLKDDCLRRHPLQISDFRYKTRCRCGWWCRSICWWEAIMHEGFPLGRPSEIGKPRDIRCCPVLHPVCCSGLIGVTPWSLEIPTPCAHRVGNAWEDWRSWDKSDSQWKISDAKLEAESVKNIRERYQWKISDATTQPYAISYYLPCLPNLWSSFASTAGSRPPTKCKIMQRHLPLQSINQNQSSLRWNSHDDRKRNRARQTVVLSMTMGVASLF